MPIEKVLNTIRVLYNEFRGIWAYKRPQFKLPLSFFSIFHNVYVGDTFDQAIKRSGYERYNTNAVDSTRVISSLHEHYTDTTRYLIAKSDNSSSGLIRYTEDTTGNYQGSWTSITGLTTEETGHTDFVSFKNKLYIGNRNSAGSRNKVTNVTSLVSDMGCPPQRTLPSPTPSNHASGRMTNSASGTAYWYIVTYLYDGFQESGVGVKPSRITMITPNDAVTLEVPASTDERVTHRKVYRTKANNPYLYYFIETVPGKDKRNILDLKGDSELLTPISSADFYDSKEPYQSKYQVVHKNRMIQGNIQTIRYAAIPDNVFTVAAVGSGGSLSAGVYKYRFRKAYIYNDGGENKYYVGAAGAEEQVTVVLNDSVNVTIDTASEIYNSVWVDTILVERTEDDDNIFYPLVIAKLHDIAEFPFTDTTSDVDLLANRNGFNLIGLDAAELQRSNYPTWVAVSEYDHPDLFPSAPENLKKMDDDNSPITGIFSEINRITVYKEKSIHKIVTNAQSSDYWYADIVTNCFGANARAICQIENDEYVFCSTNSTTKEMTIYYWRGNSQPVIASDKIKYHLLGYGDTILDMKYDAGNNWVVILLQASSGADSVSYQNQVRVLIYDLKIKDEKGIGNWYIYENLNDNLLLTSAAYTAKYGMLFGHGKGYVYYQNPSSNVDKLGTSHSTTQIKMRIETSIADFEAMKGEISGLGISVDSSGAGTTNAFKLYYPTTTALAESNKSFTLASGINKFVPSINIEYMDRFYMRIEDEENLNVKLNWLVFDFIPEIKEERGNTNQ